MEEKKNNAIDLSQMSSRELRELSKEIKKREGDAKIAQKEGYETLRNEFVAEIRENLKDVVNVVKEFDSWLRGQSDAFFEVYKEYGMLRRDTQVGYSIEHEGFKIEVQQKKYKSFDERANMASERLIEFLRAWIEGSENGEKNPIYKLAMTLLERNKQGELDYQSISKLYALESEFNDPKYGEIMDLFKESNVVERMAIKYYFYERNENTQKWEKIEPSFNRM